MSNLYDDNYGFYEDGDDPEETRRFYNEVQRDSVWKKCKRCGVDANSAATTRYVTLARHNSNEEVTQDDRMERNLC